MFTIEKGKKLLKKRKLIAEYASIISEYTKLPEDSDEVQDAALAIYIKKHGEPVIRMGP